MILGRIFVNRVNNNIHKQYNALDPHHRHLRVEAIDIEYHGTLNLWLRPILIYNVFNTHIYNSLTCPNTIQ